MSTARIVPCPTCQKSVEWSERNPHRPFCSERCKLIDFGGWASEQHVIPGDTETNDVSSDTLENHPRGADSD